MTKGVLRKRSGKNGQMPHPANQEEEKKARPFGAITSAELEVKKWSLKWLVDGVFVQSQPGVIGGVQKSLKTSLAIDLALSLGSQTPFLGKFRTPRKRRVAMFSGETVRGSLKANAERICISKGLTLADCDVLWSFKLPRLSVEADLRQLRRFIKDEGVEIAIIDPLYLCLGPRVSGSAAANLFETGPLLRDFSASCLESGATPLILHHTTKTSDQRRKKGTEKGEKSAPVGASLGDLAYAGLGEFARQWLLISRNAEFDSYRGRSDLTLTVGGSAGQAGQWRIMVNEGQMKKDFSGRKWQIAFQGADANDLEEDDLDMNW